jgi:hypothetical protein
VAAASVGKSNNARRSWQFGVFATLHVHGWIYARTATTWAAYIQHEDPDVQAGTEEVGVSGVDEGGFRFHLAFIASDGCTACSPV